MIDPKTKVSEIDMRTYFAAMALKGLVKFPNKKGEPQIKVVVELAVRYADALIARLNV